METLNPYILFAQTHIINFTQYKFFEVIIIAITVIVFFVLGRNSNRIKFENMLNLINDSENQLRKLNQQKKSTEKNLNIFFKKTRYFKIIGIVIVLGLISNIYFFGLQKIDELQLIVIFGGLIIVWQGIYFYLNYLESKKNTLAAQINKKSQFAQTQIKQIIELLGQNINSQLKIKYEKQLAQQWQKQDISECNLSKCYDEKRIYTQLYNLCKSIIAEMQKMQWCDVCANRINVDVNDIKLKEIDDKMKIYKKVIEDKNKIKIDKRMELTNLLLKIYQSLQSTLNFVCKRGCCIRFRISLEQTTKINHPELNRLTIALNKL